MLTFPNAKINLGLNITEKRPDGYHNLETIFYPIPVEDALEINILNEGNTKFRLHQAGLEIAGEAENNLVVKAYRLLDAEFNLPPVDIHLFKRIPLGAGLGGGSGRWRLHAKTTEAEVRSWIDGRSIRGLCGKTRSGLCILHKKPPDLCRRNRKHLLPCHALSGRVSGMVGQTGCFRFHQRRVCQDKASSPGTILEASHRATHRRVERAHGQ